MSFLKVAAHEDQSKAASLLQRIHDEDPGLWPHGLTVDHFAPGNLWLVKKSAAEDPVGFVGWQTRRESPYKVGYYAVGVLPEHRNQGIATQAISALLEKKAREVDCVRALIVEGNGPSERVAERLGVEREMLKRAAPLGRFARFMVNSPSWFRTGASLTSGAAVAGVGDAFMPHNPEQGLWQDPARKINFIANFIAGAHGGHSLGQMGLHGVAKANPGAHPSFLSRPGTFAKPGMIASGMMPLELFALPYFKVMLGQNKSRQEMEERIGGETNRIADRAAQLQEKALQAAQQGVQSIRGTTDKVPLWALLSGAGLLTGGLAYGAHRIAQSIKDKAEAPVNIQTTQGGRIKVTLPTRNPNDAETVLDLPFDQESVLTRPMQQRMSIDTRRRLRAENKQRKLPRGYLHDLQVD